MENSEKIVKKILHAGTKTVFFVPGTKVSIKVKGMQKRI